MEHLCEAGNRAVMKVMPAIPHAFERWHFVIPRSLARLERQTRIRTDRDRQNVETGRFVFRRRETLGQRDLVAGVQWRRVTASATFPRKDLLSGFGFVVQQSQS